MLRKVMATCSFWSALELLPRQIAVRSVWRRALGPNFSPFAEMFLRRLEITARSIPCPRCRCAHRVVPRDNEFVGICDCEQWRCDDIPLTGDDIILWQMNIPTLGRAITRALDCEPIHVDLSLSNAWQIGGFGASRLPVILSIASNADTLHQTVVEMCARLREGFILFTPTNRFADARLREMLHTIRASLFTLEDHLSLLPSGRLHASRSAGELFSPLLPKQNEMADEDSARRAFALVTTLEAENRFKIAPVLAVFRLYCAEGLSAAEVARRLHCSKATVVNRLAVIREKTGADPDRLRAYSPHLEAMASSLRHPATQKVGYAED